tara:strand:+ start:86442 stop:87029 length:588 start_codon:yes stop_codon:yes gene_type:complete
MKFINYCIIVVGKPGNIKVEINSIADNRTDIKYVESTGIVISTFTSLATPSELTDYFSQYNHNFFLFDLNTESSGVHLIKESIKFKLFGHLTDTSVTDLEKRTSAFMNELESEFKNKIVIPPSGSTKPEILPDIEIKLSRPILKPKHIFNPSIDENMSKNEITELVDNILDKGVKNITEQDKIIFSKLSKLLQKY